MLNTDIFKFEFVDRDDERKIINAFLFGEFGDTNHALWMNGERGTGKSYLLTEYVPLVEGFLSIYVNIDADNIAEGFYIKSLISQLNKVADSKFVAYIRANYKSIATIGQKALNVILSIADLSDMGLKELTSSITNHFITKYDERETTAEVVKKYILEALKKKKLVFLLDNFSQCDATSLDIISQIIHGFRNSEHIKFIICTTDEDLESRVDVKAILAEKIPNKKLQIDPFKEQLLFTRMIEHNFDLSEDNIKLVAKSFVLCRGYPQKFKEILINLYAKHGILVEGNKALFALDIFQQLLNKEEISFDIEALCREQKGAKIVLQTIALWGVPIQSSVLYGFLEFFADVDPTPVLKDEISQSIHMLENLHVLTRLFDERLLMLQYKHDSLKIAVVEYFRNDRSLPFLHYSMYEFLMRQSDEDTNPYWQRYYKSLCAYHSYESQTDDWIEINYSYGFAFYERGQYTEADSIFTRLESVVALLTGSQLLVLGIVFFKCGHYNKACDILSNIQSRNLTNELTAEQETKLHIFLARSNTCLLDSSRALSAILNAEKSSLHDDNLRIATLAAKQSLLFMTPGKYDEAKKHFDEMVREELDIIEMSLVYQSAIDYYEGEISMNYLMKGLDLSRKYSDYATEGKILNNMGFESLRCGKIEDAICFFEQSISILKEYQSHEQAHPYSNLAVIRMIQKNWSSATECIVESLFWNRSSFASLVLKTNRMLCYYFMKNQQWEKIFRELYSYLISEPDVDNKIYKKICINIAFLALESNKTSEGLNILAHCEKRLESEWEHAKYRFNNIYNILKSRMKNRWIPVDPLPIPDTDYKYYYCEIEFEPWLVTFTHD